MTQSIAGRLQHAPASADDVRDAISLYDQALTACPTGEALVIARARARKAHALSALPDGGAESLIAARNELETTLSALREHGASEEEAAHSELNLGLVIQSLSGFRRATVTEAIEAYRRALRVFDRESYPTEFAIIHNNLATAYLSIPLSDERAKMSETLAVESIRQALEVVTLVEHPSKYAMRNLPDEPTHPEVGNRLLSDVERELSERAP